MDGVLCRPILWFNLAISRDVQRAPDLRERQVKAIGSFARRVIDSDLGQSLRYGWRPPMPQVREGLAALSDVRRLVLLSGRPETARGATERWLKKNGLRDYFSDVILNDRGMPNSSFKLYVTRQRGSLEHVDDDGRVAYFLTKDADRTVYLVSWLANAGLPYPPGVRRVRSLAHAANLIRESHVLP
jgi:hypothetical protein